MIIPTENIEVDPKMNGRKICPLQDGACYEEDCALWLEKKEGGPGCALKKIGSDLAYLAKEVAAGGLK